MMLHSENGKYTTSIFVFLIYVLLPWKHMQKCTENDKVMKG